MKNNGLKILLYFAYGPLLKGVCGDPNDGFVQKVGKYLDGDDSLEKEILVEIYEELIDAIPNLVELARHSGDDIFALENVRKYVFEVHSRGVMSSCAVMAGKAEKIDREKREIAVLSGGKEVMVKYLPSLEGSMKVGEEVYFHHGWIVPK